MSKVKRGSISQRAKFRMLVGKTARENPDLPVDFVRELLISMDSDRSLAEPFALKAAKGEQPGQHGDTAGAAP